MKKQHPSSLPTFVKCQSSSLEIDYRYDEGNPFAPAGRAAHESIATIVEGKTPDLPLIADKHDTDLNDLEIATACGRKMWGKIKHHFGSFPRTEVRVESDLFRGTADLVAHDGETAVVLDWKFGRSEGDHIEQVGAYSHCVREIYGMPSCGFITGITAWPILGVLDVRKITDAWLDSFAGHIVQLRKQIGRQYSPGDHCRFCPRALACVPRDDYLRSAGNALAEIAPAEMSPAALGAIYPRAKMLEKALDNYKKATRMVVEANGPIPTGDGRELAMSEYSVTVVDPRKAWPILADSWNFTDDDMASVLEMSHGKVQGIVGARANDGEKAKAKMEVLQDLLKRGAVRQITRTKLAPRKERK